MIVSIILYSLFFLLMYFIAPAGMSGSISRIDKSGILPKGICDLLGYALAPFFVTLLLYYMLLLMPGKASGFYVSVVLGVLLIQFFFNFGYVKNLLSRWKDAFGFIEHENTSHDSILSIQYKNKKTGIHIDKVFLLLASMVLVIGSSIIAMKPLTGHDTLEYAILGKYFGEHREIKYVKNIFLPESGFYYVGLHGFSYNLIRTWEYLFASFFGKMQSDFYFRLNSTYYYLVLFLLGYKLLPGKNFVPRVLWFLMLTLPAGFYGFITNPHVDAYRLCFIAIVFYLLYVFVEKPSLSALLLFSIFCGAQGFIHSLGIFIACIAIASYFIFSSGDLLLKLRNCLLIFLIFLLMGNIHYVIDTFWGTGWIFKDIKFY